MSGAREEMLVRIRAALVDVPAAETGGDVEVPRDYRRSSGFTVEELVQRFTRRLGDYHAGVRRVAPANVRGAILEACAQMGLDRVVVPRELPAQWRPAELNIVEDDRLTTAQLDQIDGAITGCAAAIAETGTLVLDGQGVSGRRVITLVPDHHICIVTAQQLLGLVPEAIARLAPPVIERGVPVTLISGPSATSDIELERVEGVHGPRHLLVLIAA